MLMFDPFLTIKVEEVDSSTAKITITLSNWKITKDSPLTLPLNLVNDLSKEVVCKQSNFCFRVAN